LARSRSSSSSDRKGYGALVGLAALICYYIGIYLLLYLSRTRKYLADAFSAERVEARNLANALVKIAYGIVAVEDTEATQSLLRSTRHLGHFRLWPYAFACRLGRAICRRPLRPARWPP
jgi:Zn-dependent protease with chaperone function